MNVCLLLSPSGKRASAPRDTARVRLKENVFVGWFHKHASIAFDYDDVVIDDLPVKP